MTTNNRFSNIPTNSYVPSSALSNLSLSNFDSSSSYHHQSPQSHRLHNFDNNIDSLSSKTKLRDYSSIKSSRQNQSINDNNMTQVSTIDNENGNDNLSEKFSDLQSSYDDVLKEKKILNYKIDLLKDTIEEMLEQGAESKRREREMRNECEMTKRKVIDMSCDMERARNLLTTKDNLIKEAGLMFYDDVEADQTNNENSLTSVIPTALLSRTMVNFFEKLKGKTIDEKITNLYNDYNEMKEELNELKELERRHENQKKEQNAKKMNDVQNENNLHKEIQTISEKNKELTKQLNDMKFRLGDIEQDRTSLLHDKSSLEGTLKRTNQQLKRAEETEQELRNERRKLKQDLHNFDMKINDLETNNSCFTDRIEKHRKIAVRNQRTIYRLKQKLRQFVQIDENSNYLITIGDEDDGTDDIDNNSIATTSTSSLSQYSTDSQFSIQQMKNIDNKLRTDE
ncbi:hypothetical protein SNEBB_000593 [Seison nebaliae]|nr:hypothetical protein SNEBB_000593 [Seison nebaliae]